jgi:hypothetical protein
MGASATNPRLGKEQERMKASHMKRLRELVDENRTEKVA